ncbi:MAG: hypothetical protein H8F28_09625 [Fibrella sp.]|nr:hypothetical protein [Armatimonadota bacterium]
MKNSLLNGRTLVKRSSGIFPLLLLAVGLGGGISGCKNPDSQYADSGFAAPARNNTVPPEVQTEAHKLVEQFVADIQHDDYPSLKKKMSPVLREKMPDTLKQWLEVVRYQPILGATHWKFDLTNYSSGGKKIVVHCGFTGADKGSYRTNFILTQSGELWQIDTILPLTNQVVPSEPSRAGASAPPGL